MKYILTIDAGTTSVRAILFDVQKNRIIKIKQIPFKQFFPRPAFVEHDAEEIFNKALKALKEVCKNISPDEIYAVGITNQRETVVAWQKDTGKPLYNAIVWQCRRTSKFCNKLKKSELAKTISLKTGLIPDAYFSATKIKWLFENVKEIKKQHKKKNLLIGTIESYLVYRLTNKKVHITDITNASRTMLFNIKTLKWDEDLLKIFKVPPSILPTVVDNDQIVGTTNVLGTPVKIAGLIGDQQSSLFGQGCFEEGQAKNTYGTGCFMLVNTGAKIVMSKKGLLSTIGFRVGGKTTYALEGSVFNAGCVVKWAIENLNIAKNPEELTRLALEVDSNEGVYLVPAFTGLGTPYWDMDARGIITGITRGTDRRHLARAVLEGMGFSLYEVLKTMQSDSKIKIKELHVDGGVSDNDFLMQFQTDLLQTKLQKYNRESTCMGAIFLTGLATGAYRNLEEIKKLLKLEKVFSPSKNFEEMRPLIEGWKKSVARCLTTKKEKN